MAGHSDADSSPSSADQSRGGRARARARARLSCKQCRERKLKCDRQNPCRACIARGQANACTFYISEPNRQFVAMRDRVQELSTQVDTLRDQLLQQAFYNSQTSAPAQSGGLVTAGPSVSFASSPRAQLVDRFVQRMSSVHGRARFVWLENVVLLEPDEACLLGTAVSACAMASAGIDEGNRELLNESLKPYIDSLSLLQAAFTCERALERETLHAALLLSIYELLTLDQPTAWVRHVFGVGRLIEMRGPQLHVDDVESRAFRLFRGIALAIDLIRRQSSFISDAEWKTVPWSRSYPSKDLIDLVEDHIVDMPALLEESDALGDPSLDELERSERRAGLVQQMHGLTQSLEDFRQKWVLTHPGVQAQVRNLESVDHETLGIVVAQLAQGDALIAQAVCRYYAAHIVLMRIDTGLPASPLLEPVALAMMICSIIEAQLSTSLVDYMMALTMVLPLRTAYEAAEGHPEAKARMVEIWRRMRSEHGIVFAGREIDHTMLEIEPHMTIDDLG